jgi:hypothetical protein
VGSNEFFCTPCGAPAAVVARIEFRGATTDEALCQAHLEALEALVAWTKVAVVKRRYGNALVDVDEAWQARRTYS